MHNAPGESDQLDVFVEAASLEPPVVKRTAAEIIAEIQAQPEEEGRARKTDPWTAKKSAEMADLKGLKLMVANALADHGPLTTYELGELFGRPRNNVSPALAPLMREGHVEVGGVVIWDVTGRPNAKFRLRTGDGPYCTECRTGTIDPGLCRKCTKAKMRADRAASKRNGTT